MPWAKGQSGNPGGRPRIVAGVRRTAQNVADEALQVLLAVMRNDDAPPASRASAAEKVLRIAGVPMSEDRAPEGDGPSPPLTPAASVEELEAAATTGEA